MSRFLRAIHKTSLIACGEGGALLLAMMSLYAATMVTGELSTWTIQALVVLAVTRLVYRLTHGPQPLLTVRRWRRRIRPAIIEETKLAAAFLAACYLLAWPIPRSTVFVFLVTNYVLQLLHVIGTRRVSTWLAAHLTNGNRRMCSRRVMIVGTGLRGRQAADIILDSPEIDAQLIGFLDYHQNGMWRYRDIPLAGHPEQLRDYVINGHVDALFVALEPEDIPGARELFATAERMGLPVFVLPTVYYPAIARTRAVTLGGVPAFAYRSTPEDRVALLFKNVLDRLSAAIGLVLASPLLTLTAIAIKLDSPGPVFFKQTRSGLNGRPFPLYKFRTMITDAEKQKRQLAAHNEMSGPVFKIREDPRVTRVGRLLRKFSIDELPQLINVLKGDMSLVGPRPPLPEEVSSYEPWQRRKLSVKPGVTCIWQVSGRNSIGFEEWMRLDLEYIDNWSLWLDAKLLARTIPTVLKGTGM